MNIELGVVFTIFAEQNIFRLFFWACFFLGTTLELPTHLLGLPRLQQNSLTGCHKCFIHQSMELAALPCVRDPGCHKCFIHQDNPDKFNFILGRTSSFILPWDPLSGLWRNLMLAKPWVSHGARETTTELATVILAKPTSCDRPIYEGHSTADKAEFIIGLP